MKQDFGYFGPESLFWRVWKERVQLLGAERAILLQMAHPLVAAGVAQHSNFKKDPLGRLNRTLDTMLAIVFGTKEEADKSLARLAHVHQVVHGQLDQDLGVFPKGTKYSAGDPDLKMWVHATLMDTGLKTHEKFIWMK